MRSSHQGLSLAALACHCCAWGCVRRAAPCRVVPSSRPRRAEPSKAPRASHLACFGSRPPLSRERAHCTWSSSWALRAVCGGHMCCCSRCILCCAMPWSSFVILLSHTAWLQLLARSLRARYSSGRRHFVRQRWSLSGRRACAFCTQSALGHSRAPNAEIGGSHLGACCAASLPQWWYPFHPGGIHSTLGTPALHGHVVSFVMLPCSCSGARQESDMFTPAEGKDTFLPPRRTGPAGE